MIKDRRVGKFYIRLDHINTWPDQVKDFLSGMIVLRAECLCHRNAIEHIAIHKDFLEVPLGEEPPTYHIVYYGSRMKIDDDRKT